MQIFSKITSYFESQFKKKSTDVKITFCPKCACSAIKNLFLNQADYLLRMFIIPSEKNHRKKILRIIENTSVCVCVSIYIHIFSTNKLI